MTETSFPMEGTKVYRLSTVYRVYHFTVGSAALLGAVWGYRLPIASFMLALFGISMIARPLALKVIVDHDIVTVKGIFRQRSIRRSSIDEFERVHAGRDNYLLLRASTTGESLMVPDLFAFDDDWDDWLRNYRDVSEDKPISLFGNP